MSGVDFVIGGTDKAGPAMAQVEKSLERLEKKTDSLGKATSRLTQLTSVLAAGYAAVKAATAALGGLSAINAAYDQQADAVRGLETALRLQGEEVASNSARLQAFAGDIQKLTGVGDEATIALMKQASMLGVNADQMESVTKASIGLSEVLGTDMESAMKSLRLAQEGNFAAFEKQFPQMKAMQSDAEKLAFVSELAAKGLDAKADASMTVSGMAERASGAMGDLMEVIGNIIAPVRMLISQGLKVLAESLQQVLAPAAEYAQGVLENIGPIMDYVKEKVVQAVNIIVGAFTFVEVIVTNLGDVWEMMKAGAELRFEQMKNIIMHVLTEVIPSYAMWFAENFVNIIRDGLMLAFTVITNHIRKIKDAFFALWDFIKSGGSTDILGQLGEIAGRSYLEGFESSLTALPEIAERSLSDKEKALQSKIDGIAGNLGDQFAKKFADRMVVLDDELGAGFSKDIELKLKNQVKGEVDDQLKKSIGMSTQVSATESRLLTRGPADKQMNLLERLLRKVEDIAASSATTAAAEMESASALANIAENTAKTTQIVPVT
jgi:hypothetical protein